MEMQMQMQMGQRLCRAPVAEAVAVAEGNHSRQAGAPVVCRPVASRWALYRTAVRMER